MNIKINKLNQVIQKQYNNIAGIVVLKNNQVHYESYFNNCSVESRIHVYSVAKSIISILIGIAMDKGYIQSVDQKVLDYFSDYSVKRGASTIHNISIKDLMTMTTPYKYKFAPYTYLKYFMCDDWVKYTLDLLGGKGKIGEFKYTPLVGPDLLSGIILKATGQSVIDFATEHLFMPLDITVDGNVILHSAREQSAFNKATNISGWVSDSKGVNSGGWGLTLSAMDMAKIGQLYLNKGMWDGKQIVSQSWIKESTKEHSRWSKINLDYGYLWWIIDSEEGCYAAMGDGGNVIYINTKNDVVISITSLFKRNVVDRIEFIQEVVEPLLDLKE